MSISKCLKHFEGNEHLVLHDTIPGQFLVDQVLCYLLYLLQTLGVVLKRMAEIETMITKIKSLKELAMKMKH